MNSAVPRQNSAKLPCTPTPNSSHDTSRITVTWTAPMAM